MAAAIKSAWSTYPSILSGLMRYNEQRSGTNSSASHKEHFVAKRNIIHEGVCFHRCVQKEEHCEIGTQRAGQIRNRIVIDILSKSP